MKSIAIRVTMALALAGASLAAQAEEIPVIPTTAKISETMSSFPPGAQMIELVRIYHRKNNDRISTHGMPQNWEDVGWRVEGTVGFMAYMPWGDTIPLFSCFANDNSTDYFTSQDPNCEGHFPFVGMEIVGWVMPYQIEGTVPLYRCDTPGYAEDHFDTTDLNCEGNKPGAINEGILGYIWI